jgi:hypothetical protein
MRARRAYSSAELEARGYPVALRELERAGLTFEETRPLVGPWLDTCEALDIARAELERAGWRYVRALELERAARDKIRRYTRRTVAGPMPAEVKGP